MSPLVSMASGASARGLGLFGGAPSPYFILYGKSDNNTNGTATAISSDSLGNNYLSANQSTVQFSKSVINWAKRWTGGNATNANNAITDSSGNVYVVSSGGGVGRLAKYNSSGTLQWQRDVNTLNGISGLAVDSSGIYVAGSITATARIWVAKYNSSGTLQWQRMLGTTNNTYVNNLILDSSSNLYGCGFYNNSSKMVVFKYNSSGTLQWQRTLQLGSSPITFEKITIDSSANVYVAGWYGGSTYYKSIIAKYNSSGTLQWQRTFSHSNNVFLYGITIDSSANVYASGQISDGGVTKHLIIKYNSSGTLQWQRFISGGTSASNGHVAITSLGDLVFAGDITISGTTYCDYIILPNDGSKTGTYTVGSTSFIYAAGSGTDAAGSGTDAAGSETEAAGSLTDAAGSGTEASDTWTTTKASI